MVRSRRVFRLDFPGVSRHQSLEFKKRGTNNISECKIFDARSFWCGSRPRFDSIISIAVRWTFPALFCNPIYGSVRGKYSAAFSANNAISGRDSSLREKTNKPRSNSLSWITLSDPLRPFFDQTSPSVYPVFYVIRSLSFSLSFSVQ